MRSIFFVSLSVLILSTNLLSQSNQEPVQLSKNILVNSAGLPEEFLLFAPDSATQILFNPARAMNFSTNFVYANYFSDHTKPVYYVVIRDPGYITIEKRALGKGAIYNSPSLYEENYSSSKTPSFSFASLINDINCKWLFSLSNGIYTRESKQNSLISQQSLSESYDQFSNSDSKNDNDTDQSLLSVKISRIWNSGGINYSFGVFALYDKYLNIGNNDYSSLSRSLSKDSFTDSIYHKGSSTNGEIQDYELNDAHFAVGFEYSISENNLDYIGQVFYQGNHSPEHLNYYTTFIQYDSSSSGIITPGWTVSRNDRNTKTIEKLESSPVIIGLNNYIRKPVNWITSGDNIFFSLNTFYSTDSKNYVRSYRETTRSYYTTGSSGDSTESIQQGNAENKSWGLNIAAGYAVSVNFTDLYLLSGFRLTSAFKRIENGTITLSTSASYNFANVITKYSAAALTLPVYINYSPATWISLYAGLNYTWYYTYENSNTDSDIKSINANYNNSAQQQESDNRTSTWNSTKSIYAGFELKHPSGFKIQFFFDDDVASIRDWNVSLGYHF